MNEHTPLMTYDDPREVAVFVPRPNIVRVTHRTRAQPVAAVRAQIAPLNTRAFSQLPWKIPSPRDLPPDCLGTPEPNRYKDILPTVQTRVVLAGEQYPPPFPPRYLPSAIRLTPRRSRPPPPYLAGCPCYSSDVQCCRRPGRTVDSP